MRVKCECGREAVLNRPGKRKNCRSCGANLRSAKPIRPRTVQLKPGRTAKPKPSQIEADGNNQDEKSNERTEP